MRRLAVVGLALAASAALSEPRGPELQAASNFGQTWNPVLFEAARAAGITGLRDQIHWDYAERDGAYVFDHEILFYPEMMAETGMRLTLIAGDTHPDHDEDATPYTQAGLDAFSNFFAEAARRFPAVVAVEVGNEMNSETFTAGPAREADIAGRAGYYAGLLEATAAAVREARPDIRIIGGAAHSIPLAWFEALSADGAGGRMDTIALHPYTTPPEQFRRQVALLRQVPGFETQPLELTEIGTVDAQAAPALLMKTYCQAALAGATTIAWYPLSPRGDGYVPLLEEDGSLTTVGRTWQMIQTELEGLPVVDAAPDPFTYACRFGDRALVIWGAPRDLRVDGPGLSVHDLAGQDVSTPRLSRDRPLVVLSDGPAPVVGGNVHLGPQRLVADTFDQFAYPGAEDGFARFARVGDEMVPFVLGPGQQEGGVPWTPYLTTERDGWLRMDAEFLQPSMWDGAPAEIVHAFTAPEAMRVAVEADILPSSESSDGVVVSFRHNQRSLAETIVRGRAGMTLPNITLAPGDVLEIVVGPGDAPHGDTSDYRFTLRRSD
jgi:hypothetical protein